MVVMIVPLLAVLIPLFKFAPVIYGWRVRSRIYRRYGELKFLENQVNENPAQFSRAEWIWRSAWNASRPMPAGYARR
jgi:hypothetical protein